MEHRNDRKVENLILAQLPLVERLNLKGEYGVMEKQNKKIGIRIGWFFIMAVV